MNNITCLPMKLITHILLLMFKLMEIITCNDISKLLQINKSTNAILLRLLKNYQMTIIPLLSTFQNQ